MRHIYSIIFPLLLVSLISIPSFGGETSAGHSINLILSNIQTLSVPDTFDLNASPTSSGGPQAEGNFNFKTNDKSKKIQVGITSMDSILENNFDLSIDASPNEGITGHSVILSEENVFQDLVTLGEDDENELEAGSLIYEVSDVAWEIPSDTYTIVLTFQWVDSTTG